MIVSRCGKRLRQGPMPRDDRLFLAGMGAGGEPDRPPGDEPGEMRHHPRIGRRRRHIELEIAGDR